VNYKNFVVKIIIIIRALALQRTCGHQDHHHNHHQTHSNYATQRSSVKVLLNQRLQGSSKIKQFFQQEAWFN
jgi:hypothetical protein